MVEMRKAREVHVQVEMHFPVRGGKRRGAGRPPKGYRSSEPHQTRERFDRTKPLHVTLRVVEKFGTLRKRDTYFALRKATKAVLRRGDFRIVHLSPERDHIHLIVEADNHGALSAGMQAFQISAAQHLNRAISKRCGHKRRGIVFADRYHAKLIKSPTQARNALNYVLNNWRHHDQDESSQAVRDWDVDYMSSAVSFGGWKELATTPLKNIDPDERLCVLPPQTWLLAAGWQLVGPISMYAVPGTARER